MTTPLRTRNLAAEIQDYIEAESAAAGLNGGDGYTLGANFTGEDAADIQDLERMAGTRSEILLTIFDEGGIPIPSGRCTPQERAFRFALKGAHAQEALDRAHDLHDWLWNKKSFATAGYRVWVLRVHGLPQVVTRGASGSHVVDFIVTVRAQNR